MMTSQIETLASSGNSASPDFALKLNHRRIVIPEFLATLKQLVGRNYWLRKNNTISVLANTRNYDLPTNFGRFERVQFADPNVANALIDPPLHYIGEDPAKIFLAEANTIVGRPADYWVVFPGVTNEHAIRLGCPPDRAYTLHYAYEAIIYFADDTTDVNLSLFMPEQYQAGLVKLLRREIAKDRWGIGDRRYEIEDTEYMKWIDRLSPMKDAAPREKAVFAR